MIKKLDGKTFSLDGAIKAMERVRKEYNRIKRKEKQLEFKL